MKKEVQISVNERVHDNYKKAMTEYNEEHSVYKKLRSCQADVCETENYYILRSYNTIVAVISKETGCCYDVLRLVYCFTATSAQHIAKFCSDFGCEINNKYTYRFV